MAMVAATTTATTKSRAELRRAITKLIFFQRTIAISIHFFAFHGIVAATAAAFTATLHMSVQQQTTHIHLSFHIRKIAAARFARVLSHVLRPRPTNQFFFGGMYSIFFYFSILLRVPLYFLFYSLLFFHFFFICFLDLFRTSSIHVLHTHTHTHDSEYWQTDDVHAEKRWRCTQNVYALCAGTGSQREREREHERGILFSFDVRIYIFHVVFMLPNSHSVFFCSVRIFVIPTHILSILSKTQYFFPLK